MKPEYKRILFQVIFTLIALEIVLRIFGVLSTFTEKLGQGYVSYYNKTLPSWYHTWPINKPIVYNEPEINCSYPANSFGLREREIPVAKSDSTKKRLFFIGDSFTEGVGVEYPNAMPRWFEKKLDSAGLNVEVFNAGVSGSDPVYEYMLLRDKLLPLHPDMVIMSINGTDIQDCIYRGGMERFNADGTTVYRKGPWWEPAYHYSRLCRLFIHYILRYNNTLTRGEVANAETQQARWQIQQCLYETQRFCRDHNIQFVCALHPMQSTYRKKNKPEDIKALSAQLSTDSVQFIDMYPDFEPVITSDNWQQYFLKLNGHFNATGYHLFADLLFDDINKRYPGFFK